MKVKASRCAHVPLIALAATSFRRAVRADVPCNSTEACEAALRPGSLCVDGLCSNPFSGGCLRRLLGEEAHPKVRVCSTDDDPPSAPGGGGEEVCRRTSPFGYPEIRIAVANWETPILWSWIIQILLSELLDVPVSTETSGGGPGSFYHPGSPFSYGGTAYQFDALRLADRRGDCLGAASPCAHVMPEVWQGQANKWEEGLAEGYLDSVMGNGMVGVFLFAVPKFAVRRDPTLVQLFGLAGEENRLKLADTFKKPTTWYDYCAYVSKTACRRPDDVAARAPSEEEGGKYFVEGMFNGHFRYTDKNNCTLNPTTCVGYAVNAPCDWSTNLESQLHWNEIHLESDGPLEPHGGYPYGSMVEIYKAANATRSPVMVWWWRPDPLVYNEFTGTESEMTIVKLPEPTEACEKVRITTDDRCSEDVAVRRGVAEGSCGDTWSSLFTVVSTALIRQDNRASPVSRSPGYSMIKNLRVNSLQFNSISKAWLERGTDTWNYDPREAVCSWVAENLEDLKVFIPYGYPRTIQTDSVYEEAYLHVAKAMGALAILASVVTAMATYYWHKTRILRYAQLDFITILLVGLLMLPVGAVIYAEEPSSVACITRVWMVMVGYTLELVPLVVKTAAINTLSQQAKRMKRIKLSRKKLHGSVALVFTMSLIFMTLWTVLDPPKPVERRELTDRVNEQGDTIVEVSLYCDSESDVWAYISIVWQLVLLLCATVLAFQTRKVRQEFSETKWLASMIYSHFFFMILRTFVVILKESLAVGAFAALMSFLLSFDTLATISIYFVPKFLSASRHVRTEKKVAKMVGKRASASAADVANYYGDVINFQSDTGRAHAVAGAKTKEVSKRVSWGKVSEDGKTNREV